MSEEYIDQRKLYQFQFLVGRSYRRVDGKIVKILKESMDSGYHYRCVQGDDGGDVFDAAPPGTFASREEAVRASGYRYDRHGDVGRCTGSERGPRDLVPGAVDIQVGDKFFIVHKMYRATGVPTTSWDVVTKVGRKYFYTGEGRSATAYDKVTLRESDTSNYHNQAYYTEQEWKDKVEAVKLEQVITQYFRFGNMKIKSLGELRAIAKILKLENV